MHDICSSPIYTRVQRAHVPDFPLLIKEFQPFRLSGASLIFISPINKHDESTTTIQCLTLLTTLDLILVTTDSTLILKNYIIILQ
jgi:hypothetical protein